MPVEKNMIFFIRKAFSRAAPYSFLFLRQAVFHDWNRAAPSSR
jgi:hypothetical protein